MTWPKKYGGHERSLRRTLCGDRGIARCRRAGWFALGGGQTKRSAAAALRHRRAARETSACYRARRAFLLHRHERAGIGLRSRQRAHARTPRRWRLDGIGPEDLDFERPACRLDDRAGAHRRRRAAPRGSQPVARGYEKPGPHREAHRQPHRRESFQRSVLRRRVRAGHDAGRPRKAAAGDRSARSSPSSAAGRSAISPASGCSSNSCES